MPYQDADLLFLATCMYNKNSPSPLKYILRYIILYFQKKEDILNAFIVKYGLMYQSRKAIIWIINQWDIKLDQILCRVLCNSMHLSASWIVIIRAFELDTFNYKCIFWLVFIHYYLPMGLLSWHIIEFLPVVIHIFIVPYSDMLISDYFFVRFYIAYAFFKNPICMLMVYIQWKELELYQTKCFPGYDKPWNVPG